MKKEKETTILCNGQDFLAHLKRQVNAAGLGRNLIFGPNIVFGPNRPYGQRGPEPLVETLARNKFTITPDTDIIVGGECLDECVHIAVAKLFMLDQVSRIRINRKAVITSDAYRPNTNQRDADVLRQAFMGTFAMAGFTVIPGLDYITITRPSPTPS